ncbi:uncharacterized protein LOC117177268 isoform X2 [Belonocnema kinseyi]|uniref:uncharacterized protein LOC117177268 isoform X2 n=1 Tax=Belonocnema kinseyi TaxID=2817044 RepID=UPI00143D44C4|nr:uncharacterized protein LOC117177268 isoform X2 [Belonocnema kinseyi]
MKFKFFRSTFLLPFGMLISLTTGELEFYQDTVPKMADDITFEQLARLYLEARNHQQRGIQHVHIPLHLNPRFHKDHRFDYLLQKERGGFDAREIPNLIDLLQKQNLNPIEYIQQIHRNDLPHVRYIPSLDRYQEYDPFKEAELEKGMKEGPFIDYSGNYVKLNEGGELKHLERIGQHEQHFQRTPEFTFAFGEPDLSEKHPFALRPNDPRYYQEAPFSHFTEDDDDNKKKYPSIQQFVEEPKKVLSTLDMKMKQNEISQEDKNYEEIINLPEPHRRADNNPLVLSVGRAENDDIYFIAVVAGCSAAAMFALVLVSLTWCRIQRVAKAAADIEYPAYGVTGPNKDVSPSGDQRLAQSAQMYHFQHQKQQIIAMENRASANRDPGSVSEAESDEENEEGDYTVYECPGLAPTGEMEVKNPLFHDDPTPATPMTPAQIKREDH